MKARPRLALAIPTFRRGETLEQNLRAILQDARDLDIPIYVCDDSPDDEDTKGRVEALARQYPGLSYRRNNPTLGHDANLVAALSLPEADWVWLLADSLMIKPGLLREIANGLGDEDFVFLNAIVGEARSSAFAGLSSLGLVRELLWNQSLTGATIYNRRVIDWVIANRPDIKRNFPQLSVILAYSSAHDVSVRWYPRMPMISLPKTSYWRAHLFPLWVDDWSDLILSYPKVFGPEQRRRALSSHARGTGMFRLRNLIHYRGEGQFDLRSTRRKHFWDVVPLSKAKVLSALMIPRPIARWMIQANQAMKSQLEQPPKVR